MSYTAAIEITPITISAARSVVAAVHRRHDPPQGGLFAAALTVGGEVVGVAIAGRPVSRRLDDGLTIEVTRVAVVAGHRNGCTMLYAAICRAAAALGYRRAITYTCDDEPGTSCKAAGFTDDGPAGGVCGMPNSSRCSTPPATRPGLSGAGCVPSDIPTLPLAPAIPPR